MLRCAHLAWPSENRQMFKVQELSLQAAYDVCLCWER